MFTSLGTYVLLSSAVALTILAAARGNEPALPYWGASKQWTCNVTLQNGNPQSPVNIWNFTYYYDATIPADRYEHQQGQNDEVCKIKGIPDGAPCTVIDTPSGAAYVMGESVCCKFPVPIGPVIYDWVERSNGSFYGPKEINGVMSDVWTAEGQYTNYFAQAHDEPHLPVRFWEYKHGYLKKWDFHLDTYVPGPPASSLFVPPPGCESACERSA